MLLSPSIPHGNAAVAHSDIVKPVWIVRNMDGKLVPKGIAFVTVKAFIATLGGTKVGLWSEAFVGRRSFGRF